MALEGTMLAGGNRVAAVFILGSSRQHCYQFFEKPMIDDPLSTFVRAGAPENLIISAPQPRRLFGWPFGDGSEIRPKLSHGTQAASLPPAETLIVAQGSVGSDALACGEIALRQTYISLDQFDRLAEKTARSSYGEYLQSVSRSFRY